MGIGVFPTGANTRVLVANTHIHDNGVGVLDGPGNAGVTSPITTLRNDLIADNTCGASVGAFGVNMGSVTDCGTIPSAGLKTTAQILAYHNTSSTTGRGCSREAPSRSSRSGTTTSWPIRSGWHGSTLE